MASASEISDSVSVGRVFSRGFGVIADNPATVVGIAFLIGTVPSIVIDWFAQSLRASQMDTYAAMGASAITLATTVVGLVLGALVQGSIVRATLAYARGERATFGESVGAALPVILPLIGLGILLALAVGLGLVLLIVPGVMLYVVWSVASPALVAERTGVFAAFSRSRFLTKGARWKVFGVEAILLIGYWILLGILGATMVASLGSNPTLSLTDGLPIRWIVSNAVIGTAMTTVWSTVQTSLYVELRNWKEGLPEQALSEIFA